MQFVVKYLFFVRVAGMLLPGLCLCSLLYAAEIERDFAQFGLILPDQWDGDEQTGFVSNNPDEYQLTLGRKDESGDSFLARVSIFILPNKNGVDSREAARRLAEAQGGSSEPGQEGKLWIFTGEPRSQALKGIATTMVNATPEKMLIIIAQDPQNLGSDRILESLHGLTPQAKELLGR